MAKKISLSVLSIILGITFLFSAYTKLFPIELFEFSFIEIKVANWTTAPFIARLFLSLEFGVGALLLLNFNGSNRWLAKTTLGLLVLFTIYLLLIILVQGNNGNCGCFGTTIKMTPLESIIKNIFLMSLTGLLLLAPKETNYSTQKPIILATIISSLALPLIINPITFEAPPSETQTKYSLKLDKLYSPEKTDIPTIDLTKGKHIIAFLSLTCPHCKLGAQKLYLIQSQHPDVSIYFILNGEQADLKEFLEETKTTQLKYSFMTVAEGFIDNAGLNLPAILCVNNTQVENRTKYTE